MKNVLLHFIVFCKFIQNRKRWRAEFLIGYTTLRNVLSDAGSSGNLAETDSGILLPELTGNSPDVVVSRRISLS